jgi:uncharacterized membrane protein
VSSDAEPLHKEQERTMAEDQIGTDHSDDMITAAAVSDGGYTLLVADFPDTDSAWEAYEALREVEDGRHVEIEGVLVVKRDAGGEVTIQKATDHSTTRGLKWGLVGGAVAGLIFPPSILGSAAVLGGVGAAAGKARQLKHRSDLGQRLEQALPPGHSGLVAMVANPAVIEMRKALAKATAIVESAVDDVVAKDIRAIAKETEAAEKGTE